jgi:hypothetical protein
LRNTVARSSRSFLEISWEPMKESVAAFIVLCEWNLARLPRAS